MQNHSSLQNIQLNSSRHLTCRPHVVFKIFELFWPLRFSRISNRMLLDGQWVPSVSGTTFATVNPATGEKLADIANGFQAFVDFMFWF